MDHLDKIFKTTNEAGETIAREDIHFADVAEDYGKLVDFLNDEAEQLANTQAELVSEQTRNADLSSENSKLRLRILDMSQADVASAEAAIEPDVDALDNISGADLYV